MFAHFDPALSAEENARLTALNVPKEDCGDFKRGMCTRGSACKFSHGSAPAASYGYAAPYGQPAVASPYAYAAAPSYAAAPLASPYAAYAAPAASSAGGDPNSPDVCGDWRSGKCVRAYCKYRHSETPGGSAPSPYAAYAAAAPAYSAYPAQTAYQAYAVPTTPEPQVCGDWRRGKCTRGDTCKYEHQEPGGNPNAANVCGDWRNKKCERGPACKFRHSENPPAAAFPSYPGFADPYAAYTAAAAGYTPPAPAAAYPGYSLPYDASAMNGTPTAENVCGDWRRGQCTRSHCKFRHSEIPAPLSMGSSAGNPQATETCGDWRLGRCVRPACKYRHSE